MASRTFTVKATEVEPALTACKLCNELLRRWELQEIALPADFLRRLQDWYMGQR